MLMAALPPQTGLAPALLRSQPGHRRLASRRPVLHGLSAAVRAQMAALEARGLPQASMDIASTAAAQSALQAAAALLAALALHLGGAAAPAHASAAEDALLQLVRQVEARVDSTVEALKGAASPVSARG